LTNIYIYAIKPLSSVHLQVNILRIFQKLFDRFFYKKRPSQKTKDIPQDSNPQKTKDIPQDSNPQKTTVLRRPKQISFEQMTEGMRLLLCEIKEGSYPHMIDLVTIIDINIDHNTITVKNQRAQKTTFIIGSTTDKGWQCWLVVLRKSPQSIYTNQWYTFFIA